MTESLFVYGTLQDPEVQTRVFGRVTAGSPDTLDGYFKSSISIGGNVYPIAVETAGAAVSGRVLDVTAAELAQMDIYEGAEYRRIRVRLRSGREAWVYCA
jgi:gamma-glutamylcyclotransferase (GGCT)/AIG2-like uncharacterized protein YtfP